MVNNPLGGVDEIYVLEDVDLIYFSFCKNKLNFTYTEFLNLSMIQIQKYLDYIDTYNRQEKKEYQKFKTKSNGNRYGK